MGITYLHPQNEPNNGANRSIAGTNANVRVPNTFIPGGTYWTGGWSVQGGTGITSVGYDGSTFRINGSSLVFRGGNPGTAGNRTASGYFGDSFFRSWDGGMGGYIVWAYNAPGAPNAPSVSRSSNGTSLTATTSGGSGRVTYHRVALNGVTNWADNGTTWGSNIVGAHTTYNVIAFAGNEDNSSAVSGTTVSYGIPTQPRSPSATRSTSVAGRIAVSWTAPEYIGAGINYYHVYRDGAYLGQYTSTSINDDGTKNRGQTYTYTVYANNSTGWSPISAGASAVAPGVPSAPGVPTVTNKVGRTLTINSTRNSLDYGNAISEYRIQLSTDNGATWKGWNNSSKTFTADGTYNTLDSSGNITYELLSPALTYRWRVYAVNSIGTGDFATTSTGLFVSSGGKRWNGTAWTPTETAKRWDGSTWIDVTVAKRWDGSAWVDLT